MGRITGRITDADRERVRDASRIDVIVSDYVALKRAGAGNLKGLCPFHDEKTASFTVSVDRGFYHCFGCGEGGDVFDFLMKIDSLGYVEAVQYLADKAGITLTAAAGGTSGSPSRNSRSRLVALTAAAAEFYARQLAGDEAELARRYLTDRGFDGEAARHFGCGFAPSGWDSLIKHLATQGFAIEEMMAAGVAKQGARGPIDQFHRRLTWAIKDAAGDVVGFGARRIFDDDRLEAKYVNTSGDSGLYHKSKVLYGLDLARRDIVRSRQAVIVEGYTDVMAMHLAGVPSAVASCGTAFGDEHIGVLRRYLMDSDVIRGEVVYVFDGDEAGQNAALKAFDSDQKFAANTFVAIAPDGMDPCELRQARGDAALRDLVRSRVPLFRFAISRTLEGFDLDTVEGRAAALAATAPMVAKIKDPTARDGYVRELANRVGTDAQSVSRRVGSQRAEQRRGAARTAESGPGGHLRRRAEAGRRNDRSRYDDPAVDRPHDAGATDVAQSATIERPNPRDPATRVERETIKLVLQFPRLIAPGYSQVRRDAFTHRAYAALFDGIAAAGGPANGTGAAWVDAVSNAVPAGPLRSLVTELAVESVLQQSDRPDSRYVGAIVARMAERVAAAQERDLASALRRAEAAGDKARAAALGVDLGSVTAYRRALSERARGIETQ